jgi:hypothetical protein
MPPGGRSGLFLRFLGGLVISNPQHSYHVSPNPNTEPHLYLSIHPNKVPRAWDVVLVGACCLHVKPTGSSICFGNFWPSNHQPHCMVEMTTMPNEISYFNTATTHKPRLYIVQHEAEWLCY